MVVNVMIAPTPFSLDSLIGLRDLSTYSSLPTSTALHRGEARARLIQLLKITGYG